LINIQTVSLIKEILFFIFGLLYDKIEVMKEKGVI